MAWKWITCIILDINFHLFRLIVRFWDLGAKFGGVFSIYEFGFWMKFMLHIYIRSFIQVHLSKTSFFTIWMIIWKWSHAFFHKNSTINTSQCLLTEVKKHEWKYTYILRQKQLKTYISMQGMLLTSNDTLVI